MGLNIKFDRRALADLIAIRDYLMDHSPTGAEHVRTHIVSTIERLVDYPRIGRPTDEPDVRVLPLTRYPYLIFYSMLGNTIAILHIRHAARKSIDPGTLK